jgi:hypothetical protein
MIHTFFCLKFNFHIKSLFEFFNDKNRLKNTIYISYTLVRSITYKITFQEIHSSRAFQQLPMSVHLNFPFKKKFDFDFNEKKNLMTFFFQNIQHNSHSHHKSKHSKTTSMHNIILIKRLQTIPIVLEISTWQTPKTNKQNNLKYVDVNLKVQCWINFFFLN